MESYDAHITDTTTGETRTYVCEHPWEQHSDFLWSEGNFGCDCNRALFFARAAGEDDDIDLPCGETRFRVRITGPNGKELYRDEALAA